MPWPTATLHIEQISYARGSQNLFHDFHFSLSSGECVQLMGANGCGKTTLLQLLAGLRQPHTGHIYWNHPKTQPHTQQYRQQLLYLGHQPGLKPWLTVEENIQHWLALYPSKPTSSIAQGLQQLHLSPYHLVSQLSAGQQQRLSLMRLHCFAAPLWLLDEPLTALDSEGETWLQQKLQHHLGQDGMVVVATHRLLQPQWPIIHLEQRDAA